MAQCFHQILQVFNYRSQDDWRLTFLSLNLICKTTADWLPLRIFTEKGKFIMFSGKTHFLAGDRLHKENASKLSYNKELHAAFCPQGWYSSWYSVDPDHLLHAFMCAADGLNNAQSPDHVIIIHSSNLTAKMQSDKEFSKVLIKERSKCQWSTIGKQGITFDIWWW